MRSRACLASSVVCSDTFLELPHASQSLYLQLSFHADNDGAIEGLRGLLRLTGATQDDFIHLAECGLITESDGILFIAHWRVNNRTDKLNYRPGQHQAARAKIDQGENNPYQINRLTTV